MFSSLRYRNYRLFFVGQLISTLGMWIQMPVMQWLVWDKTHQSKFQLGLLAALGAIPMTLLSPVGGLVAERFEKRRILLVTQPLLFIAPVALAVVFLFNEHLIQVEHLYAVAIFTGVIMAFDVPARQSFVVDMVQRPDVPNAIALNSFIFNLSRMIGPIIGVFLFSAVGPAICFAANGFSYLALAAALLMMTLPMAMSDKTAVWLPQDPAKLVTLKPRRTYREPEPTSRGVHHPLGGFLYTWNQKDIRITLILLAAATIFGWSFLSQLAAFADEHFKQGKHGFGLLLTAFGAGALVGALTMAYLARVKNRRRLILAGQTIFVVAVTAFIWLPIFWLALAPMFLAGLGLLVSMSGINSHIQMEVSHRFHGRVMGVYAMFFGGVMPIGSLLTGYLAEELGLEAAVQLNIAALALVTLFAAMFWRRWNPGALSKAG
jgi:MFS family permease